MQKQLALFIAILLAVALPAENPSSSALAVSLKKSATPGKLDLLVSGLGDHQTDIVLQDLSGKAWFSMPVKKTDRFERELDVQNLPAAIYVLAVRNKQEQQNRVFRLDQQGIVILETSGQASAPGGLLLDAGGKRKIVARVSNIDAEKIWVHFSNLQEYRPNLQLMSENGDIKWEKDLAGQPVFGSAIDLDALTHEPGLYFLCLNAGSATLVQEITVQPKRVKIHTAHHSGTTPTSPALARNR